MHPPSEDGPAAVTGLTGNGTKTTPRKAAALARRGLLGRGPVAAASPPPSVAANLQRRLPRPVRSATARVDGGGTGSGSELDCNGAGQQVAPVTSPTSDGDCRRPAPSPNTGNPDGQNFRTLLPPVPSDVGPDGTSTPRHRRQRQAKPKRHRKRGPDGADQALRDTRPPSDLSVATVTLMVSGIRFDTNWATLLSRQGAKFESLFCDQVYPDGDGTVDGAADIVLDRDPGHFETILRWLERPDARLPLEDPAFVAELDYFGYAGQLLRHTSLCVVGGWQEPRAPGARTADVTGEVLVLDPRMDRWVLRAQCRVPRQYHDCAAVGDTLFVCGGVGGDDVVTDLIEKLDTRTMLFDAADQLAKGCHSLRVVGVGDNMFSIGGITANGHFNGRLARLDVRGAAGWSKMRSMPAPRSGMGAAAIGGCIFVVGGWDGLRQLATVLRYDLKTNRWSAAAPMRSPRYALGCAVSGGLLYAVGGGVSKKKGKVSALRTVEVYDPASDKWTLLPPLSNPRMACACVSHGDNVVVLGGQDSAKQPVRSVELYNPVEKAWRMVRMDRGSCERGGGGAAGGVRTDSSVGRGHCDCIPLLRVRG